MYRKDLQSMTRKNPNKPNTSRNPNSPRKVVPAKNLNDGMAARKVRRRWRTRRLWVIAEPIASYVHRIEGVK